MKNCSDLGFCDTAGNWKIEVKD